MTNQGDWRVAKPFWEVREIKMSHPETNCQLRVASDYGDKICLLISLGAYGYPDS